MKRLTAAVRDGIIDNAIKNKKFQERDAEIVAKRKALVEKIRQDIIQSIDLTDAQIKKSISEVKKLSKHLSKHGVVIAHVNVQLDRTYFTVNIGGTKTSAIFRRSFSW